MNHRPFKLLFVCMGNICRSPAAEGVMIEIARAAGLAGSLQIDSAGTGGWHAGKPADPRMRRAAEFRGYDLKSLARQVTPRDLEEQDLILVMDQQNLRDIAPFDPERRHTGKVRLFCEFCAEHECDAVPDPYYGGPEGFELVLDLLEDGCAGVLRHIEAQLPSR